MTAGFAESTVEEAAHAWLSSLGFAVAHGPEIAVGQPEACEHRTVISVRAVRPNAFKELRLRGIPQVICVAKQRLAALFHGVTETGYDQNGCRNTCVVRHGAESLDLTGAGQDIVAAIAVDPVLAKQVPQDGRLVGTQLGAKLRRYR